MPFLKSYPKSKRALPISTLYLAEPVQKVHLRVTASMELQKIVFTFYPRKPNLSIMNFHEIPVKNTLDATIFKLHLKCWVNMEVPPRFELGNEGFADLCLTTWPRYRMK